MTKTVELREYATDDLRVRLTETREELFKLRFQHATGQLENYGQLGELRREIARLATLVHERETGITAEPAPETAAAAAVSRRRAKEKADEEEVEEEGRRRRRLRRRGGEDGADAPAAPEDEQASADSGNDEDEEQEPDDE